MSHKMLGNNSPAVSAFFTFRIALKFLSYCSLGFDIVVHSDCSRIYFSGVGKDKCLCVYVPPIATLIFHEIAD